MDGRPAKMPRTGATADDRELATEDNAQPNPIAEPKDVVQSETTTEPDDATEPDSSAEDSLTVSTPGTTGAHVLQALGARPALYPRAPFLADLRGLQDEPDMHRQITAAPAPVGGVHPDGLIDELDEVEQPVEEEKRRTSRRVAAMNDAAVAAAAAVAKAAEEAEAEEAAEAAVVDVPTTRKRVRPAKKAARKKVAAAAKKAAAAPKKAAAPKTVATAPKMVAVAPKTVSTTPKLVAAAPNKVTTAPTKAPHTYSTRSKGEPATPVAPVEQAAPIKSTATRPNNASNKATAPANDVPRAQTTAAKSRATQAPPAQTDATKSKKSAGNKKGKKANKVIPKTLGAVEQPVAGPSNYAGAAVEQVVEYGEVPVTVFSVGSVSARGDKSKGECIRDGPFLDVNVTVG